MCHNCGFATVVIHFRHSQLDETIATEQLNMWHFCCRSWKLTGVSLVERSPVNHVNSTCASRNHKVAPSAAREATWISVTSHQPGKFVLFILILLLRIQRHHCMKVNKLIVLSSVLLCFILYKWRKQGKVSSLRVSDKFGSAKCR